MPSNFKLMLGTRPDIPVAEMYLLDSAGSQLNPGYHEVDFTTLPLSQVHGLFNLRDYVQHYAAGEGEPGKTPEQLVDDISVFLGQKVLGGLLAPLIEDRNERTLTVYLPDPSKSPLAAALARVPWEIARSAPKNPTLADTNLVIHAVTSTEPDLAKALPLKAGQPVRVLLVFAEAPDSRPLAERRERRDLLALFAREVFPYRQVEVDVLAHGVTRTRLRRQVRARGGYHIVHWSGHGDVNLLALYGEGDEPDAIAGDKLMQLFIEAGGYIPRLFFLSACESGSLGLPTNLEEFRARVESSEPSAKETSAAERPLNEQLAEQPGYTGTAYALLLAGAPTVVAMRYAVGDDYARDLALSFYRRLLVDREPKPIDSALNLARNDLKQESERNFTLGYHVCDHATPMLYGCTDPLTVSKGRSDSLDRWEPRPEITVAELRIREHSHFVGRTRELAGLGAYWIGESGSDAHSIALIQGTGGLGKTALAAESLDLWHRGFDWVFVYQAKPQPLRLEEFLLEFHTRLIEQQGDYAKRIANYPAEAVWRVADDKSFLGEARHKTLRNNLLKALRDEAILLVLDNFETNLKPSPVAPGSPVYACKDPEWDRTLKALAEELADTRSRVLITSRLRPEALGAKVHVVRLGPLPLGEAALFVRHYASLRTLLFGTKLEQQLIARVMNASRGHPLLLDRLAKLVEGGAATRLQLNNALDVLEAQKGYAQLPDIFTGEVKGAEVERERAYLQDALETSIDSLLGDVGPEARHLLWVLALANEPVSLSLLSAVWRGLTVEESKLERIRELLSQADSLPSPVREKLAQMPDETHARIKMLPPPADPAPLLAALATAGLVEEEWHGKDRSNSYYRCHELVRERIVRWIDDHPAECRERTETQIWTTYGEILASDFDIFFHQDQTIALECGLSALAYLVRAEQYERLGGFVSTLVTASNNPRFLKALLPLLETAAENAPIGKPRWSCRTNLADALSNAALREASLPHYEQAAVEAETAKDWGDLAQITHNWADALRACGRLDEAKSKFLQSAELYRKAGHSELHVLGCELEALHIEIRQGRAEAVLSEVETRAVRIADWYERSESGVIVSEAPDQEDLLRGMIRALDISRAVFFALQAWMSALAFIDWSIEIKRKTRRAEMDIAGDIFHRAVVLLQLECWTEAQAELEDLLPQFNEDHLNRARVLSALANLFYSKGDYDQAVIQGRRALALRNQYDAPRDRAISHGNLAIYLESSGGAAEILESPYHQLAALVYQHVAGLGQDLDTSLLIYANHFKLAQQAGKLQIVPTLAELLARSDFESLRCWLDARNVDQNKLQIEINHHLQTARLWAG